ncbi:MAG: thiamine pyrophosphate-dependent enzyme, partial [Actinomycetota bacterium]|nr:thiamine pyrophosphate-dependent enzyme [Actinomycetota bacterium]
ADLILRADPVELLHQIENRTEHRVEPGGDDSFARAWLAAESEERTAIESGWTGQDAGAVHAALARSYADGELVYTASSLPIRDQEVALPTLATDVHFMSNRGANGIDGLLASGLGSAGATGRPVTVITGDLGFFHDVASLALARGLQTPVRIVVLDNGGGGIFSRLPQKTAIGPVEFEALFGTPSGLSVEAAAKLYGLPYHRVDELDASGEWPGVPTPNGAIVLHVPVAG